MHKFVMADSDLLFFEDHEVFEYSEVVSLDPKIKKQLLFNYVACKNLIEVSDQETDYMYDTIGSKIKVFCFKTGQVVWVDSDEINTYIFRNLNKGISFITEQSFNRIFNLCKELINKINDSFR